MQTLLGLSRWIDDLNGRIGRAAAWLVLVAAVISSGNAIVRKTFDMSSNAWLDAQWWLYAMVFLLAAPWALRDNDHIRIDVVSGLLSPRQRGWIDLFGHIAFLLPVTLVILVTAWPYFLTSFLQNEQAKDAGGLPQWPIKALIPLAFTLLLAQAVSEIVKRIAILRGDLPEPGAHASAYHEAVTEAALMPDAPRPPTRMYPKTQNQAIDAPRHPDGDRP
ncbi:MAG: TRAP transporter small permease subunit [Hyphomicrobium sp.]|nr:TRAP transporter small permease subunit [Hyphomicrobium sp.]